MKTINTFTLLAILLSASSLQADTDALSIDATGNVNVAKNVVIEGELASNQLTVSNYVEVTGYDTVYKTKDGNGHHYDLIGTYQGWQPPAKTDARIYIAGYNQVNTVISPAPGYAGPPIYSRYVIFGTNAATVDLVKGDVTAAGAFNGFGIVPVGSIVPFAGPTTSLPAGWLACDGAEVSRTTYASLFGLLAETYGTGDGTSTFNLPDYRGMFMRGTDDSTGRDPDSASRTAQVNASGGNGTATGDKVGSWQEDDFKSHTHGYSASTYLDSGNWSGDDWDNRSATTGATGGNETRPKNVYVNYIIRVQ